MAVRSTNVRNLGSNKKAGILLMGRLMNSTRKNPSLAIVRSERLGTNQRNWQCAFMADYVSSLPTKIMVSLVD